MRMKEVDEKSLKRKSIMKKRFVTAAKAIEWFRSELERMYQAAECNAEQAAYWWNRITDAKAEATPDGKVLIEVDPYQVERLLREYFEESFNEHNLQRVCFYLGLLCPPDFVVATGVRFGVFVTDEENYVAMTDDE